jgi:GAF domain-containing protein
LVEATRETTFSAGGGLMGLVWERGEPLWSVDLLAELRARDAEASRQAGIKAALVIPIVSAGKRIGVMEFSSRRPREADERLLQSMRVIGSQIGQFLARQEQQRHIARLNRIYAVLSGINSTIVRVRRREELFREACRIAVSAGGFRLAWFGLV